MRNRIKRQQKVVSTKTEKGNYVSFSFCVVSKTPKSFTYSLFGEEHTKPMSEYSDEYREYVIRLNY